jgi:hypothetical protein
MWEWRYRSTGFYPQLYINVSSLTPWSLCPLEKDLSGRKLGGSLSYSEGCGEEKQLFFPVCTSDFPMEPNRTTASASDSETLFLKLNNERIHIILNERFCTSNVYVI